jgi:hypothetical protein
MHSWKKKLILIEFCVAIFGCTDIQVHEDRKTDTTIGDGEKISFILDRSTIKDVEDAQRIEIKIEKCIENALKKLDPPVETVSAETFRKTAFPDMDYLSVPSSPDSIMALLNNPEFKIRINLLRLRYLLVLQSQYSSTNEIIGGCFGGGVGAACLVFLVWNNETKMSVCVIDLAKACNAGEVKAEAVGHPWVGIVLIFPFGFPAFSEGPACNALGKQVANFIVGNRQKQK